MWHWYVTYHVYFLFRAIEHPYSPLGCGRTDSNHERFLSARWIRRHCCRKPPFHRRAILKRQRYEHCKRTTHENNYFDIIPPVPYWRILDKVRDNLGKSFENICNKNPKIMEMFGNKEKFMITTATKDRTGLTRELLCHVGSEIMLDLTKLTETGSVFRFQSAYHMDANGPNIIFDSGASVTISPSRDDFITYSTNVGKTSLSGITSEAICAGKGKVRFNLVNDNGDVREIETEALHVPSACVQLLSVQRYCTQMKDGASFHIDDNGCYFTFTNKSGGGKLSFDLEAKKMLPQTSVVKQQWSRRMITKSKHKAYTVVSADNLNLDNNQKTLLEWHWKLGHYNMNWIRYLIANKFIKAQVHTASTASCLCAACQLAKQTCKNEGSVKQKLRHSKDGA
jgi:hypothetical protein